MSTVRKTVVLDGDVYAAIKDLQTARNAGMKDIVNAALRIGIAAANKRKPRKTRRGA